MHSVMHAQPRAHHTAFTARAARCNRTQRRTAGCLQSPARSFTALRSAAGSAQSGGGVALEEGAWLSGQGGVAYTKGRRLE